MVPLLQQPEKTKYILLYKKRRLPVAELDLIVPRRCPSMVVWVQYPPGDFENEMGWPCEACHLRSNELWTLSLGVESSLVLCPR